MADRRFCFHCVSRVRGLDSPAAQRRDSDYRDRWSDPALSVAGYKGVLLSTSAQLGWRTRRWLEAAFALSGTSMGAAILVAIASNVGNLGATRILRFIPMWLLVPRRILIASIWQAI
jgi:hypothetical protein